VSDADDHLPQPHTVDDGAGPEPSPGAPPRTDTGATIAISAGIIALLFTILIPSPLAIIAGPLAIFMGWRSMRRIDRSGGTLGGRARAKTGLILGIVGTVLLTALLVWFLLTFEWEKKATEPTATTQTTEVPPTTEPG